MKKPAEAGKTLEGRREEALIVELAPEPGLNALRHTKA